MKTYWMDQKPFLTPEHQLSVSLEDQLLEFAADGSMKILLVSAESLACLWIKARSVYPELAEIAIKILHKLPSTYLYETAFSTISVIKTKHRNHFDILAPFRDALFSIERRLVKLTSNR